MGNILETLKVCLEPKDGNPKNRPNCQQILKDINEFSVDKNNLKQNIDNLEEFRIVLDKQGNNFLKNFFNFIIDN